MSTGPALKIFTVNKWEATTVEEEIDSIIVYFKQFKTLILVFKKV